MIFYSFDDYWKRFGKFHHEVIFNPRELEQQFYIFAKKVWEDCLDSKDGTYEQGHSDGWDDCEEHYKIENKV